MGESDMATDDSLADRHRFPLLTPQSERRLRSLWEDRHAPRFNHRCGDRLSAEGLARVRAFEAELARAGANWGDGEIPLWVIEYARAALEQVPFYRDRGGQAEDFFTLAPCGRADLARAPWSFVPDDAPLDDLIVYDTSGTTGHPVFVPSHPVASSMYLPLLRGVLARHGVTLEGGDRVSIVLVCAQNLTFTFASVSAYLDGAGYVKLNLSPHAWRDPADRLKYLEACAPEIITGDPLSFVELAKLPLVHRPKALVSTSMALLPGLRAELSKRFACPVIDVYSLTECRLIAASRPADGAHELAAHDVYVEILDDAGNRRPAGARGEVAITGGRNPFLSLVRYRTGDYAALDLSGPRPALVGLEGRPPTRFLAPSGKIVNNIDVSLALREMPLSQFCLHQARDGSLMLRTRDVERHEAELERQLLALFGAEAELSIEELTDADLVGGKIVQYTSDLSDADLDARERSYQDVVWQGVKRP
jgi:phenylacetate-CoA ligase